jgi:hypothetical protein
MDGKDGMMTELLFEMPENQPKQKPVNTCGKCANSFRPHEYRHDWIYCKLFPSARTFNGRANVKSRDAACRAFTAWGA